jgi:pimeloyl-ACP methyl ester carboxylesterase
MGGGTSRRIAALVVAAAFAALAAGSAVAAPLARCSTTPVDRTLCGRVVVPLDRTGALPGTIGLRVRALPPARGAAASGTVLALAGGPGQAAVPLLPAFAAVLRPALRTRQLVTFDQRGTGGSGRLHCNALTGPGSLVSVVGRCAAEMGPGRAAYTSTASVADVEAVRAALGAARLILYGASYGTKVALLYAATYPQRVERLVLDSVVAPEGIDPFQRTTLASIPRVLRTLCERDCRFTRDAAADLAALSRQLGRAPLRGSVLDGRGMRHRAALTRPALLALLLVGDFDRFLRAGLPAATRAALDGDAAPLLRLAGRVTPDAIVKSDSDALYVATTCEDGGVPWPAGTPVAERRALAAAAAAAIPDAAFAPFDRATVRRFGPADLCRAWPESPIVQPLPPLPPTPALILSGDDDLRTPRADALALAARLPGAQLLQVPDAGHGVLFSEIDRCGGRAVAAFLDGGVARACRAVPRLVAPLALPPRRLAGLRPVRGVAGRAGRTLTAVVRTLDDASEQLVAQLLTTGRVQAFGGLRAGSAAFGGRSLRLRRYSYVRGVAVSGPLPVGRARVTLRVSGRAAAPGRIVVTPRGLRGELGGVAFDVPLRALRFRAASASATAPSGLEPSPLLGAPAAWAMDGRGGLGGRPPAR